MSAGNATLMIVAARIVDTVPIMTVATTHARCRVPTWNAGVCSAPVTGSVLARANASGSGGQGPPGEREGELAQFIPDVAAADALGERIELCEPREQRGNRGRFYPACGKLHRGLAPAPHACV